MLQTHPVQCVSRRVIGSDLECASHIFVCTNRSSVAHASGAICIRIHLQPMSHSQFPASDSVEHNSTEQNESDAGSDSAGPCGFPEDQLAVALIPSKRRKLEHTLPAQLEPPCTPCCLCGSTYEDCVHVSVCMRVYLCVRVCTLYKFILLNLILSAHDRSEGRVNSMGEGVAGGA